MRRDMVHPPTILTIGGSAHTLDITREEAVPLAIIPILIPRVNKRRNDEELYPWSLLKPSR